jgi:regulator of cell morphogenesis and NO signaling
MEINPQSSLGLLAAEHPEWIAVFERLRLDFCCHGERSLTDACRERGLDPAEVLAQLAMALDACGGPERCWLDAPMTELADHIEATHHAFARLQFETLATLAPRVVAAHAGHAPWLHELQGVLTTLAESMHDHMVREERVLFPWLRRLDHRTELHTGPPWSVRRPISCMVHDHDEVAESLARIRTLTGQYRVPAGACGSFRGMLTVLKELEQDTHVHIHKENNILFPAGVRAERAVLPSVTDPQAGHSAGPADRTSTHVSKEGRDR